MSPVSLCYAFHAPKPCGFRIRRKAEAQVLGEHQWKMTQQWA